MNLTQRIWRLTPNLVHSFPAATLSNMKREGPLEKIAKLIGRTFKIKASKWYQWREVKIVLYFLGRSSFLWFFQWELSQTDDRDSSLEIRIWIACRCFAGSHKKITVTHWSYDRLLASPRADLKTYPEPQLFVMFPQGTPAISIRLESLAYFSGSGLCLRSFSRWLILQTGRENTFLLLAATLEHVARASVSALLHHQYVCTSAIWIQSGFFHMQLTFPFQDSSRE